MRSSQPTSQPGLLHHIQERGDEREVSRGGVERGGDRVG